MLHSGSRGLGNKIGSYFIEKAQKECEKYFIPLPDKDLAYLVEGTDLFDDYIAAVSLAQEFALSNRGAMMSAVMWVLRSFLPQTRMVDHAVNCHHNYVNRENHFGQNVIITRKGAVRARETDLGIIPGSMGAKSYIVRGKGNPESFCSCSHGAGRRMGRREAERRFTVEDHIKATQGVECRKDKGVLDETPMAYKDIDAVMAAQTDLVDIVATLKQIVCVKG
jgi:tRNA-splicing ligase RtcB